MTELKFSVEENPIPADLQVIERALVEHNEAKSEPRNYKSLTVVFVPLKDRLLEACVEILSGVGYSSRNYGWLKIFEARITVQS